MAVAGEVIKNLLDIEGIIEVTDYTSNALDILLNALKESTGTSAQVDDATNRLKLYIKALKDEELNLLDKFGISCNRIEDGEKELQKKFNDYYNASGLSNFIGNKLERMILDEYSIGVKTKNAKIARFVKNIIVPEVKEATLYVASDEVRTKAAETLNRVLNGKIIEVKGTGAKVDFKREVSSKKAVAEDGYISPNKLTTAQKARIKFLLEHSNDPDISKLEPTITYDANDSSVVTKVNFNWYDITEGKTKTEAKALSDAEKADKNNKIIALILTCVNQKYQPVVKRYLNIMVSAQPELFFVGGNVKDITGLLGELSALIAISELLHSRYRDKIIAWVAQEKPYNKESSIDILLKNIAGIQVKNTSIDTSQVPTLDIHFAEGQNLLSRLETYYHIDFTELEDIFISEGFNVPVLRKGRGGLYQEVSRDHAFTRGKVPERWGDLIDALNARDEVINKTKDFLTMFSPDFLYMSGGTTFANQLANITAFTLGGVNGAGIARANTLYIIAGVPHFASSMLKDILENLKKLQYLQEEDNKINRVFDLSPSLGSMQMGSKNIPYNYAAYKSMGKDNTSYEGRRLTLSSSYLFSTK